MNPEQFENALSGVTDLELLLQYRGTLDRQIARLRSARSAQQERKDWALVREHATKGSVMLVTRSTTCQVYAAADGTSTHSHTMTNDFRKGRRFKVVRVQPRRKLLWCKREGMSYAVPLESLRYMHPAFYPDDLRAEVAKQSGRAEPLITE